MAEKTTAGYLPGNSPEAMQANLAYQEALLKMQESLNTRKNRMFDPEMLALAQGFLAPTQTGGFGESLGYAAKNIRDVQAQQEKEEIENAKARLGLASAGIEMERIKGRERLARDLFGLPTGTPTGTPFGAPAGALPGPKPGGALSSPSAPPGFNSSMGVQTMPANPDIENRRNQFIMSSISKGADPADIIKDLAKFDQDRFIKSEAGIQDLGSGLFFHTSTKLEPKQIFISPTETATINVTPGQAAKLDELAASGDPGYYDYVKRLRSAPPSVRPQVGATSIAGQETRPGQATPGVEPSGERATLRTIEQEAQDLSYRKERGTLSAKEQSDEAKAWFARGNDANSLIDDIRVIQGIFNPQNKYSQVLTGVFEKGDIKSQIGTLVESGLLGDSLKDAARKIATNAGLPPPAVAQFQVAVSRMADLKLKASRIMEGQGTVTEPERRLIAESVINITDTPLTVMAKADYLAARARFEARRAEMLRDFRDDRRDYNDFVKSEDYKRLKKDYERELEVIVERRLGIKMPSRDQAGRNNQSAKDRLPESTR